MVKNLPTSLGGLGLTPGLGRSSGGGDGNPVQCSCLETPHGQRSLVGCSLWAHRELDTIEQLTHTDNTHLNKIFYH